MLVKIYRILMRFVQKSTKHNAFGTKIIHILIKHKQFCSHYYYYYYYYLQQVTTAPKHPVFRSQNSAQHTLPHPANDTPKHKKKQAQRLALNRTRKH